MAGAADQNVELEIPARPEFVALARMVVAAIASSDAHLPDDRIDDLKIAVSEACTNAIEAHDAVEADERVVVRCRADGEVVEVTLAEDSPAAGRMIAELGVPRDATIVAIVRKGHVVVPRGETQFQASDEVLALVTPDSEDPVKSLLISARP